MQFLSGLNCLCYSEARAIDTAERLERCAVSVQQDLVWEVCGQLALQVCDQVFQVDVVARLQVLTDLQHAVELTRAARWLAVWRKVCEQKTDCLFV